MTVLCSAPVSGFGGGLLMPENTPDLYSLHRLVGELVSESRVAREAREANARKLDKIFASIDRLMPLLTEVERHGREDAERFGEHDERLDVLEKDLSDRKVNAARRAGLVAGYGLAAGTGGAFLQRFLEWIGTFR